MKPRYSTSFIDVEVLAYNFGQAEIKAFEHLKRIESSLERPREYARLYSIIFPTVSGDSWRQKYLLKFIVFSINVEDFNNSNYYKYVQKIEKKVKLLYTHT